MISFERNWLISEPVCEMFVAIASKDITIKVEQARTHGCRHFYNTRVSRSCKCHKKFSRIAMRKSTDVSFCQPNLSIHFLLRLLHHLRISKHDIEHETFCKLNHRAKFWTSYIGSSRITNHEISDQRIKQTEFWFIKKKIFDKIFLYLHKKKLECETRV